jgi:hypothetical protein
VQAGPFPPVCTGSGGPDHFGCFRAFELLPIRKIQVPGKRIQRRYLGQAGELSIQLSFDGGKTYEDSCPGFDRFGQECQVSLYQAGLIRKAGPPANLRHANRNQYMVANRFCLHFGCI